MELSSGSFSFRQSLQSIHITRNESLLLCTTPVLHLMFTSERFFVGRILFCVDHGDRAIDFGCPTTSAGEMISHSLFERTRGSTVKVRRLKTEDVEPGWHDFLVVMPSLDSASIRPAQQRRDSLGVARDSSTRLWRGAEP